MKLIRLDETDSTNEYLKRARLSGDVCVVADRQTGGRGTKGRSFSSEEGGIYASFQREYKNFPAENAFAIMIDACTAVCRTLSSFGIAPVIRWPNDVLARGLKISGTLIENTLSSGHISRSIIGMGINVNNKLPQELDGIATTMRMELGRSCDKELVLKELIANMSKNYSVAEYCSFIDWFGSEIILRRDGREELATAEGVAQDGRLVCRSGGNVFYVSAAEVSLRLGR